MQEDLLILRGVALVSREDVLDREAHERLRGSVAGESLGGRSGSRREPSSARNEQQLAYDHECKMYNTIDLMEVFFVFEGAGWSRISGNDSRRTDSLLVSRASAIRGRSPSAWFSSLQRLAHGGPCGRR